MSQSTHSPFIYSLKIQAHLTLTVTYAHGPVETAILATGIKHVD